MWTLPVREVLSAAPYLASVVFQWHFKAYLLLVFLPLDPPPPKSVFLWFLFNKPQPEPFKSQTSCHSSPLPDCHTKIPISLQNNYPYCQIHNKSCSYCRWHMQGSTKNGCLLKCSHLFKNCLKAKQTLRHMGHVQSQLPSFIFSPTMCR